jgi:hypothetical protein
VGVELLSDVGARGGLGEVRRCELEHARALPAREQAEEIAQVGPRLEAVELAAREQRAEGGVGLGAVVAADESSRPGELPPGPLSEPYLNVSIHTAL